MVSSRSRQTAAKEKEAKRDEPLMSELAKDYLEWANKNKRPDSIRNDRGMLVRIILPRFGKFRVSGVTNRDIERLHGSLKETPYHANRVLSLLSKMFNLAVDWKMREDNPVHGVKRYREDAKEKWLNLAELRNLDRALNKYRDQEAADTVRLLILTGAREGEVLKAEWSQFDFERGVWTKPSHHTKQKRIEHVPLNRTALQLVKSMWERRRSNSICFQGRTAHG